MIFEDDQSGEQFDNGNQDPQQIQMPVVQNLEFTDLNGNANQNPMDVQNLDNQDPGASKKRKRTIKFELMTTFFNRLMSIRGRKKSDYVKNWVRTVFKNNRDPDFTYSILRLLLPAEDRARGNYGVKQRVLAKIVKITLNLNKDQYDRLTHYKNPSYHQSGVGIGDFALCLFSQVEKLSNLKSQLTVAKLNQLLDSLAGANHIDEQVTVFRKLFQISNADEIKWITRIILKDLKLNIKVHSVFHTFHRDANQYFNMTTSLEKVCEKFQDPSIKLSNEISLFHPIRPMLAGKKKMQYFSQYQTRFYYAEVKYDGERIQAHVSKDEVRLFSRNAVDYTQAYAVLIPILQRRIQADSCIIDGELVVVDKKTLAIQPFGLNKCVAQDKEAGMQLCYKVFDLLWLKVEGEQANLMGYPLRERKKLLQKVVTPQAGLLDIVEFKELEKYDDILTEFNASIERNQEGLMLKDPQSLYLPKERGNNWLKLKGEYVEGLTDTFDLVVIGGYFGSSSYKVGPGSHWTERVTCFLLGLIIHIDKENPKIAYAMPFCKVGSGYNQQQLALLRSRLKNNLILNDGKTVPQFMNHPNCKWKPKLDDKPDCYINYLCNSYLLEVKASELIESPTFSPGYTLRFPRVVKARYDKQWSQGMTRNDLDDLKSEEMYNRNFKRKKEDSGSDEDPDREKDQDAVTKRKKLEIPKKKKDEIMSQYMCVDIRQQKKKSHIFQNMQFNVLNIDNSICTGTGYTKHLIQKEILLNNGLVVQNPLVSTHFIVCDKIDFRIRLLQQNSKKKEQFTFIKPSYVFNCAKAEKILPLSPIYLTVIPPSKREFYRENFDKYGDSYTNKLDRCQLDQLLKQMNSLSNLKSTGSYRNYKADPRMLKAIRPNKLRTGKVSYCLNVDPMIQIKLRNKGNAFVQSLSDEPNSIIIKGELDEGQRVQVQMYLRYNQDKDVLVERVEEMADLINN